jgi:hypothetical protein
MQSNTPYLMWRHGQWVVVKRVPKYLRERMAACELRCPLGADLETARKEAPEIVRRFKSQIDAAHRTYEASRRPTFLAPATNAPRNAEGTRAAILKMLMEGGIRFRLSLRSGATGLALEMHPSDATSWRNFRKSGRRK